MEEINRYRLEVKTNRTEWDNLVARLSQMEKEVEELKKVKADIIAQVLISEEGHGEANTRLSIAEGKKVQVERDLATAKKDLREHDHYYLQLSQVLETCKKNLFGSESKVTELNVELAHSQEKIGCLLHQLSVAHVVRG